MTSGRWVARPCTNPIKSDDEPPCWCSIVVVEETDETIIPSGCVSSVDAAMIADEHNERPALLARVDTMAENLADSVQQADIFHRRLKDAEHRLQLARTGTMKALKEACEIAERIYISVDKHEQERLMDAIDELRRDTGLDVVVPEEHLLKR